MKAWKNLIWIPVICFTFGACSVKDDIDGMIDTTEEMKDTTKRMEESTEQMKDRMEDAFHGLREGIGEEKMDLHFDKMMESENTSTKVDHALIFFAAMDFQHWQGDYEDSELKRDQLIYKNVEYFFSKINGLVDDSFSVSTPLRSGNRNKWKSLGALAVAMSKIHPDQVARAEEQDFIPISFYDILAAALLQKEKYENSEEVPTWVEKVLEKEQTAIHLMQLRHNFFKGVILGEFTDFEDGMFDGMLNKLGYSWMGATVNLKDTNKAKLKKWVELTWKARKTQELLEALGEDLKFNNILSNSFAGITFVDYLNYPPNGLMAVDHGLGEEELKHAKEYGGLTDEDFMVEMTLSVASFPNITINTLSPDLQDIDVETNFYLRYMDLQSYGLDD